MSRRALNLKVRAVSKYAAEKVDRQRQRVRAVQQKKEAGFADISAAHRRFKDQPFPFLRTGQS